MPPGGLEALARGTQPPSREFVQLPVTLADTLTALADARSHDDIADVAMRYIAARWRAALLLVVEGRHAVGLRGHGSKLDATTVQSLSIELESPSMVKAAIATPAKLITTMPPGADDIHDHLEVLLGVPRFPAAVAIVVGTITEYVLVIGDPHAHDVEAATGDLNRIATALGVAFSRLDRR
jgi:hypothetical protein